MARPTRPPELTAPLTAKGLVVGMVVFFFSLLSLLSFAFFFFLNCKGERDKALTPFYDVFLCGMKRHGQGRWSCLLLFFSFLFFFVFFVSFLFIFAFTFIDTRNPTSFLACSNRLRKRKFVASNTILSTNLGHGLCSTCIYKNEGNATLSGHNLKEIYEQIRRLQVPERFDWVYKIGE